MSRVFTKRILSKGLAEKLLRKGYRIKQIEYDGVAKKERYHFVVEGNFFNDLDYLMEDFKRNRRD